MEICHLPRVPSELSLASPRGLCTQTTPISAKQEALSRGTGAVTGCRTRMRSEGHPSPPPPRCRLERGPCLSQPRLELVSPWDAEGQVSTLGVYTTHRSQQTHLANIPKKINKASLTHVE